jgi:sugar phosphate isomerase/epimerase
MKKGISIYFGFKNILPEEKFKLIKDFGFDCIMTSASSRFDKQNGTIEEQMELFKKYNISPSSLHMRYIESELPEFFKKSEIGDRMEKNLKSDVEIASKYGFKCVVVHLKCEEKTHKIGFERIKRVLKVCEEKSIPLAIENIDDPKTLKAVFNEIKSPFLKLCYDSGHNHFIDPDFDYLSHYKDKVICLHLHDNMGKTDDHTLNKYGSINWETLAKKLAQVTEEISLDYELLLNKRGNESKEDVLEETFNQACQLEEMIKKYKVKK